MHDDQTSGGGGSAGPDSTTTYEYDANDRLLAETKDVAGGSTADRHTEYGYSPTDQTAKTVYEGLDDTGDVVQEVEFLYDATGRMTGVTMTVGSATTTVSYKYDHNGFRVEATVDDGTNPPVTTIFHVDPANPTGYAQVVEQGVDGDSDGRLDASEIEKAFIIGLDPITQATASALGHFLSDAHGSTKAVLNAATSSVVERYVYSAYGQDLGLDSSPATNFRYAGEYIDPITGLSFNRARWYDPSNGRWNRLDPWEGSIYEPLGYHGYLYGQANPANRTDPTGLYSYAQLLMSMAIIATVATVVLLPMLMDVKRPSIAWSMVPVLGSVWEAAYNLEQGNYGWAAFYTFMAIGDLFFVKALATAGVRTVTKLGELGTKEVAVKAAGEAGEVTSKVGGIDLQKVGGVWVKEVRPSASGYTRWLGETLLEAQARALDALGDLAPKFYYSNGRLIIEDVGTFSGGFREFLVARGRGSWALTTIFNDIWPRNIGSNGLVFDPFHPFTELAEYVGNYLLWRTISMGADRAYD